MNFTNAKAGVHKIHVAEMMSLFAAFVSLVVGLLKMLFKGSPLGVLIVLIFASALMLVAEIMTIVGIRIASRDETAFRNKICFTVAVNCFLFFSLFALLLSLFSEKVAGSKRREKSER